VLHTFGQTAHTPTYTATYIDHRAVRTPPGGVTVLVDENKRDERVNTAIENVSNKVQPINIDNKV